MATIKSHTDLPQSKKLAEILPLESADYYHAMDAGIVITTPYITYCGEEKQIPAYERAIPCWSLTALLNVLPKNIKVSDGVINPFIGQIDNRDYRCVYLNGDWKSNIQTFGNNPVDACYEMILKLHELKIL